MNSLSTPGRSASILSNRTFFLTLDNIWTSNHWEYFCLFFSCFLCGFWRIRSTKNRISFCLFYGFWPLDSKQTVRFSYPMWHHLVVVDRLQTKSATTGKWLTSSVLIQKLFQQTRKVNSASRWGNETLSSMERKE